MRRNILFGTMALVWLVLIVSIIWQGTDGKWYVEDAQKIGTLAVAEYTNQIIVVAVSGEQARLSFYEKDVEWELVVETEAVIGKNGLGKTKEGDGKTPTGAFRFIKAFGIFENPGAKMEYTQVDERHYWVDDSGSRYYNEFVDIEEIEKDWGSAEHICEYGESYHYVLATSYNEGKIAGAGSAVFLHCTSEGMESTAGCVAVPEFFMEKIIKRVEAQCVLVIDDVDNILNY